MITIKEYPLNPEYTRLRIPIDGKVLAVEISEGKPVLCVAVDESNIEVKRDFLTFLEGDEIFEDESIGYVGNYQLKPGSLIGYVYEMK